jgi:hypothetical protein
VKALIIGANIGFMVRHFTVLVSKDTVLILYGAPSFCIRPVLALSMKTKILQEKNYPFYPLFVVYGGGFKQGKKDLVKLTSCLLKSSVDGLQNQRVFVEKI